MTVSLWIDVMVYLEFDCLWKEICQPSESVFTDGQ